MGNIQIRMAKIEDLNEINQLVERVFNQFVAPRYTKEGIEKFKRYIDLDVIRARFDDNHLIYLAEDIDTKHFVGMLEVKNHNHISLFFVDKEYMGKSIGRDLLEFTIKKCTENGTDLITVNSSPNAVEIYRKLGFSEMKEEQLIDGIKFIPMNIQLLND